VVPALTWFAVHRARLGNENQGSYLVLIVTLGWQGDDLKPARSPGLSDEALSDVTEPVA